jgi:HSP20 family molecular chaperone IbpA
MFGDEFFIPGLLPWTLFDDSTSFAIPERSPWSLLDDCCAKNPVTTHAKGDKLEIEVEVPRYKADELKVEANAKTGVISVRGDRKENRGQFHHRLLVSPNVYEVEKQTSELKDGVFIITIPVRKVDPKKLEEKKQAEEKKQREGAVATTGSQQVAVSKPLDLSKNWPPQLSHKTEGTMTTYTCQLPPDVKPEDVQVSVLESGVLRVRAKMSAAQTQPGNVYRESATWEVQFPLPEGVHRNAVKAELKDGLLMISASAEPQATSSIPVQHQ